MAAATTTIAEDCGAELRVEPQEFGPLRRGGGPPAALRRCWEDPATMTATGSGKVDGGR